MIWKLSGNDYVHHKDIDKNLEYLKKVNFLENENKIIYIYGNKIETYNWETEENLWNYENYYDYISLCISPDGDRIAVGTNSSTI